MRKRIWSVLLAAVMVSAMVAGCGKSDDKTSTADEGTKKTDTAGDSSAGTDEKKDDDKDDKAEAKADTKYGTANEGKFVVGFDQEFPPMGFVAEDGSYTGFDLELAKEVADRLGLEFVAQPIAWDAKDMELQSGTIDCIWNGFTVNGREDDYTFSESYLKNAQVFVVNGDSIKTKADLAGKIVEVQADSSAEKALNDDPELTASFANVQTVPDYNTAMMDLEQGSVDVIAMDKVVAAYQMENKGTGMKILADELQAEEYAVGFLKGNDKLKSTVDSALQDMAKDGKMAEISTKWFGEDITIIGK